MPYRFNPFTKKLDYYGGSGPAPTPLSGIGVTTGIVSGGILSAGIAGTFNLTALTGAVRNRITGVVTPVTAGPFTNIPIINLIGADYSFIKITPAGGILQQVTTFTASDYEGFICIGYIAHPNHTSVTSSGSIVNQINYANMGARNLGAAIGDFNVEGNIFAANGTLLTINISSGTIYSYGAGWDGLTASADTIPLTSKIAPSFYRSLRNDTFTVSTSVDTLNYDNAGVLTAIPVGNKWVAHLCSVLPDQSAIMQYGQTVYNSFQEAKVGVSSDTFIASPTSTLAVRRYFLIVKQGTTNLATAISAGDALFQQLDKFGSIGAGVGGSVIPPTISVIEDCPVSLVQSSNTSVNIILITKIVAAASLTVTKIYFFATSVAAGDTIMVGIYDTTGATLHTQGQILSASIVVGYNVVSVPAFTLVSGTVYRVALKGVTGAVNFAAYTSLGNALITSSLFNGAGTLPASTAASTAATTAPYIAIGV